MDDLAPPLPDWWPDFIGKVREALDSMETSHDDRRPALKAEMERLAEQRNGWLKSLSNPQLPDAVRAEIEREFANADVRRQELKSQLEALDGAAHQVDVALDEEAVRQRLDRLDEVLAANNPTLGNLMLAMFIDRIDCDANGTVRVRTCKLGLCDGITELLSSDGADSVASDTDGGLSKPVRHQRRRGRLKTDDGSELGSELADSAEFVTDPDRFAGLNDAWFWIDELKIPEATCWHKEHAIEVATKRREGLTQEALAALFAVSLPTIRRALRHAETVDPTFADLPRKLPRANWAHDHAEEVVALYHVGERVSDLCKRFGKSEPTIRKAIAHADQNGESGGTKDDAAAA